MPEPIIIRETKDYVLFVTTKDEDFPYQISNKEHSVVEFKVPTLFTAIDVIKDMQKRLDDAIQKETNDKVTSSSIVTSIN